MRKLLCFKGWDRLHQSRQKYPTPKFAAGFTIFSVMVFRMATLAFFRVVSARVVENHWILGIVRLASIGVLLRLLVRRLWFWFQLRRWSWFVWLVDSDCCDRLLVRGSPLRLCCGEPLRSSTTRLTSSLMVEIRTEKSSLRNGDGPVKMLTDTTEVYGCWPWSEGSNKIAFQVTN